MSRFKLRGRRQAADVAPRAADVDTSDVKIVQRDPVAPVDDSADLLAELSVAFSDDDTSDDTDPDASEPGAADDTADDDTADNTAAGSAIDESVDASPAASTSGITTIAIGGDDDLPDAVYLDDELGLGTGDADTVFIDDDGTGDAVLPQDATARGIEPRLRQRRIGVRRAEGRRRLKWMAVVGTIAVIVIGVLAVLGSSWFSVESWELDGLENANRSDVAAVIEDLIGTPVLLVDTDEAEERLERIAWIESARVRTDFPSSVSIEIRERTPVATARGADGRFRILDAEGRVLDVIDGQPIAFVLVTGAATVDLEPGQFADVGTSAAAAMVPKLTPEIRSRLVSMSTTPDGSDLRFLLSNEPGENIEARLGAAISDNDQLERLVRLERVLGDVIGSDTTVIDVSTAETTER